MSGMSGPGMVTRRRVPPFKIHRVRRLQFFLELQ